MTFIGKLTPLTRHGIRNVDQSPLKRSTFEEVVEVINQAAVCNEEDELHGVSECIVMGRPPNLGTRMIAVEPDKDIIEKFSIPMPTSSWKIDDQDDSCAWGDDDEQDIYGPINLEYRQTMENGTLRQYLCPTCTNKSTDASTTYVWSNASTSNASTSNASTSNASTQFQPQFQQTVQPQFQQTVQPQFQQTVQPPMFGAMQNMFGSNQLKRKQPESPPSPIYSPPSPAYSPKPTISSRRTKNTGI